jgi:outer membrane receptor for monomeric catechols
MSGSSGVIRSDSAGVMTRTSATAAALAQAVMLSGNAQAQTSEEEEPGATLPEIVVRGQAIYKPTNVDSRQYTEPLRDVPQSVTVIPRALIEEQNATSLRAKAAAGQVAISFRSAASMRATTFTSIISAISAAIRATRLTSIKSKW